ncbi:MAG: hypothetical protein AB1791_08240 [Chloroflexota bacterium]
MQPVTVPQITEVLEALPDEKLAVVYDFVSYLFEKEQSQVFEGMRSEAFLTMLASESVLARDWDTPEEDETWADL